MGNYVINAVHNFFFFFTGYILPNLNSKNFLIKILKTEDAIFVNQFRSITRGNFLFKIITKTLADQLHSFVSNIIPINQYSFVRRRRIHDCIYRGNISPASEILTHRFK